MLDIYQAYIRPLNQSLVSRVVRAFVIERDAVVSESKLYTNILMEQTKQTAHAHTTSTDNGHISVARDLGTVLGRSFVSKRYQDREHCYWHGLHWHLVTIVIFRDFRLPWATKA